MENLSPCHETSPVIWDHTMFTCHPTQVNVRQASTTTEGWRAELSLVIVMYLDGLPVLSYTRSFIQVVTLIATRPGMKLTFS